MFGALRARVGDFPLADRQFQLKFHGMVIIRFSDVEIERRGGAALSAERQIFAGDEEIACTALPAVRVTLSALFACAN